MSRGLYSSAVDDTENLSEEHSVSINPPKQRFLSRLPAFIEFFFFSLWGEINPTGFTLYFV